MSEVSRIAMVNEYWKLADEAKWDEFARMETGFRFYIGDQWDGVDLKKLYEEKRPALTVNLILPIVNLLSGIQRQGRGEISVTARKGGDARLAEALTQVLRHCMDATDGDYEIADCFLDGVIGNKGWLGFGIGYGSDPVGGDVVLEKVSPFDMREDPDAREYDLNRSGRFVIRDRWMDEALLRLNWPGKAKDMDNGGLEIDPAGGDVVRTSAEGARTGGRRYRVRECWWKRYEKRMLLVNMKTGAARIVGPGQKELALAVAQRSESWRVRMQAAPILCKTVTAGGMVLEDIAEPYGPMTSFPYVRFCPYWVDGYVMGVTQNLIGPQQEINKRRSQALHNLNQAANSGYVVKKVLNNYDRHLAKFGAAPGVVLDESKAGGKIERLRPAPISEGHVTAAALSADDMKEISGVNFDLLGQLINGHNESGKAIELRQAQGMKVVEVVFDNFARTQKLLAAGLVDLIRFTDVYSEDEIKAIADVPIDSDLLSGRRAGRYGIAIESSASSPTARYANFMSILEIARMFPGQVGARTVLEHSNIKGKERILQEMGREKRGRKSEARSQNGQRPKPARRSGLEVSAGQVNMVTRPGAPVGR